MDEDQDVFTLTAEVTEYVDPFPQYGDDQPQDGGEIAEEAPAPAEDEEVVLADALAFPPLQEIVDEWQLGSEYYVDAQSIVPGQPDYLLRDSSTWTEDEYSQQLFGEPGHTWAEMGFV